MKVCHVGPFKIGTSNGSYNALWSLACAQAEKGDEVTIIRVGKPVEIEQSKLAEQKGIKLLGFPCSQWSGFWKDDSGLFLQYMLDLKPDIVHLQYVRVPKYYSIANILDSINIPFVISLHGGVNSTEMTRKKYRKLIYWYSIEKKVHGLASGIHFITKTEMLDYYNTIGNKKLHDKVIPNAVEIIPNATCWHGISNYTSPKISYFGRYDIWHKGIDLIFKMIRHLHDKGVYAELHLYGLPGDKYANSFRDLKSDYEDLPIYDHGFVEGLNKFNKMADSDFYIQYSRFELFGMSLVEAMGLGVPVIISDHCDLAALLEPSNCAVQIPMEPNAAAETIVNLLSNRDYISDISKNGKNWALTQCAPQRVAEKMANFYQQVLNG